MPSKRGFTGCWLSASWSAHRCVCGLSVCAAQSAARRCGAPAGARRPLRAAGLRRTSRKPSPPSRKRANRPGGVRIECRSRRRDQRGRRDQDPTAIVAAEPMENFDVARYRIADYADCVGSRRLLLGRRRRAVQARRGGASTGKVQLAQAGREARLVIDIDETSLSAATAR